MIGESMGDKVLLVVAEAETSKLTKPARSPIIGFSRGVLAGDSTGSGIIAGALNLIGSHALFGRNWGCSLGRAVKNLHFELCYYQVGLDTPELFAFRTHTCFAATAHWHVTERWGSFPD